MQGKNAKEERRKHPRISKRIRINLQTDDSAIIAETRDLSCVGTYCKVNKHLPLFSKFKIAFELSTDKEAERVEYAECYGVVVRVEKARSPKNVYDTAIFFSEIAESEKRKIADFVDQHAYKTS